MMVGHFFAVDTAVDIGNKASRRGKESELCADADQILNRIPNIFGEILTVCPGIGAEFLLIKALHGIQCLLCRVAKIAVGVPLERSKVIEPGRGRGFLFLFYRDNLQILIPAFGGKFFCLVFPLDLLTVDGKTFRCKMYIPIRRFLKMLDLFCPICQHCQYGGLHPANTKKGMIAAGIEAGGIYAY